MSDEKLESLCDAAEAIAELIRKYDGMSIFRAKDRACYEKYLQNEKKWRDYVGKCRKLQEDMIFNDPKYMKIRAEEEKLSRKIEATEKELSEKNEGGKTGLEDVRYLANLLDELKTRLGSVSKKRDDLHASLSGPYEKAKAKIKKPEGPDPREWLSLPTFHPTKISAYSAYVHGIDDNQVPFDEVLGPLARYVRLTIIHDKVLSGPTVEPINNGIWPNDETIAEDFWGELQKRWDYSEETRAKIKEEIEAVKLDSKAGQGNVGKADSKIDQNINTQNFHGILGNVQAENVQTGDKNLIYKHTETEKKKKGIFRNLWFIISAIVAFLSSLLGVLNHLGWLESFKAFFSKLFTHK